MSILELPIDVMAQLALELELTDILSLCSTSKRFNYAICQKESFWLNKLLRDYPFYKNVRFNGNYRDIYEHIDKEVKDYVPGNTLLPESVPGEEQFHRDAAFMKSNLSMYYLPPYIFNMEIDRLERQGREILNEISNEILTRQEKLIKRSVYVQSIKLLKKNFIIYKRVTRKKLCYTPREIGDKLRNLSVLFRIIYREIYKKIETDKVNEFFNGLNSLKDDYVNYC